jgi:hypothetical protein
MSNLPSIPWTNRERAEIRRRLLALEAGGGGGGPVDIDDVTGLTAALAGKQATLVSATNIKTVNGSSLLGSGNLVVSGGGGGLAETFETVSKNLPAAGAAVAYSGGEISTISYSNGIVKTFSYGPDGLSTVVLSGLTPGGIDLTKTLTYSAGQLSGFTYS